MALDAGSHLHDNSQYMQPQDAKFGCLYGKLILQYRSGSSPMAWMLVRASSLQALPCGSHQQAVHAHQQRRLC